MVNNLLNVNIKKSNMNNNQGPITCSEVAEMKVDCLE